MKVGAVLLAAGQGRRFGGEKLLADLRGRTVIDHALDILDAFAFDAAVCVVRPNSSVTEHVASRIRTVVNPHADLGMGTSLAVGVAALPPVDAAFILLADMPDIPAGLFAQTVAATASGADIVVPVHNGQQGHPVLFARRCFPDLMALTGDTGAKAVIRSGAYTVVPVESDSPGILRDIDVPGDLDEA